MKKDKYPLKKQLFCKKCGYRSTSKGSGDRRRYYVCLTQASHKTCTTKVVNANKIEKVVTEEVRKALLDAFDFSDIAKKMLFYWLREAIISELTEMEKVILCEEETIPDNIWQQARSSIDNIRFFINQYEFHEKLCLKFSSINIFKIIEMFVKIEIDFETKTGEIIFQKELEKLSPISFDAS